jgi:predicted RNA-binding protein YlxR (DUF448 family)
MFVSSFCLLFFSIHHYSKFLPIYSSSYHKELDILADFQDKKDNRSFYIGKDCRKNESLQKEENQYRKINRMFSMLNKVRVLQNKHISNITKLELIEESDVFPKNYGFNITAGGLDEYSFIYDL